MMLTFVEANIEASPPVIEDGRLNHLASLHASALAAVADAQRDVDLYIRAQTLKGPRRDDSGIVQRLLKSSERSRRSRISTRSTRRIVGTPIYWRTFVSK